MNTDINIGNVIATYRKEKGLSQVDLATRLETFDIHVGNAAVSTWELLPYQIYYQVPSQSEPSYQA